MLHEDGAAYYPVVATVSLGSATVLDIYGKRKLGEMQNWPKHRVLQERKSLLVTKGELYIEFLHGIKEVAVDEGLGIEGIANWGLMGNNKQFAAGRYERSTRVSLTFRDVLKVKNLGAGLKFLGRGNNTKT